MSEEQLKYALDQFENQTKGSHEKAYKMILFHDSQLKIYKELFPLDQDYIKMYDRTHPLMLDVELKFNSISATEWDQWSQTGTVNNFVKSLQGSLGKAHDWENRTAAVYGISNPMRFKQIWGVGLKKFNGTNAEAIGALLALSTAIGADANPLMIAIKAEVDAAYAIGNPAHHTQEEKMGTTALKISQLHAACRAAMKMEYRNAGLLMDKFPENENNIQSSFHDMALLQSKQQTEWNLTLEGRETKDVATRTQIPNSKFRATAMGGTAFMYLASTPGGIDSTPVELTDMLEKKFTAADFEVTDYAVNRHITVVNQMQLPIKFKLDLG